MKDSITGKQLEIAIDPEYGPYIQVSDYEDYDYLEDQLTEKYGVEPFATKEVQGEGKRTGYRIYFGKLAKPGTMQKLVNSIELISS